MSKPIIWFQTTRKGQRQAYRYDIRQMRTFRMKLAKAEMLVATGQADEIDGHPFPQEPWIKG